MNMIAERTRNVKSLAIFVRLSFYIYRPSLESQTGFKDNGAVLVTWLDSVKGSTAHDASACKPLIEIEPSCYRKIGRRYEMCDSMGSKGRPWFP